MSKKVIKYIVELFYIFIIPLILICATTTINHEYVYDDAGNFQVSETTFNFDNSIIKYTNTPLYINYLNLNQMLHNNLSPFTNTDYWIQSTVGTATINNGNIIFTLPQSNYIIQNFNATINHKYYIKMIYYNYYTNGKIILQLGGNDINVSLNTYQSSFENIYTSTANTTGYFGLYNDNANVSKTAISSVIIIDLTKMYGIGYEPTLTEIQNNDLFNTIYEYTESEIISIESNDIISENYKINYTIWGNIHHSFIDGLDLNESPILNYVFCYIILWFIMFITWHLFYLLFDKLFHLRKE